MALLIDIHLTAQAFLYLFSVVFALLFSIFLGVTTVCKIVFYLLSINQSIVFISKQNVNKVNKFI